MDAIFFGSSDKRTFVRRVLDHISSQDDPVGRNPPSYGDPFRGKARDGPMGYFRRPAEPKMSGVANPQVSSMDQVPSTDRAESHECPETQTLRARLNHKYGDTFFSGRPVFLPPVPGLYGEAKIRPTPDVWFLSCPAPPSPPCEA